MSPAAPCPCEACRAARRARGGAAPVAAWIALAAIGAALLVLGGLA